MPRNLVICSYGTGNTFAQQVSNVSHLVRAVDLADCDAQLVFYDQGIGTNPNLVKALQRFKDESGGQRKALEVLEPPKVRLLRPLATLAGLTVGYGLSANLEEMYQALAKHYNPATDRIFLFGFSRGAFTVRALAGLLYRCGIPSSRFAKDSRAFHCCFAEAYAAYRPHCEDWVRIDRFKKTYEAVEVDIHFLGLWDTVKSYGGLLPRSLPHLRHNPIVRTVRHALALHERRSWFLPTSWGGIDGDADVRTPVRPDVRYMLQSVDEVWFIGCHSDVGGGDDEAETAKISFRWMLGEATHAGLLLAPTCEEWIFAADDSDRPPRVNQSYNWRWWLSDRIPRWELDNGRRPPGYPVRWQGHGARCPENFRRHGHLQFHSTTGVTLKTGVTISHTRQRLTRAEVEAMHSGEPR